jgi:hypothetical protein
LAGVRSCCNVLSMAAARATATPLKHTVSKVLARIVSDGDTSAAAKMALSIGIKNHEYRSGTCVQQRHHQHLLIATAKTAHQNAEATSRQSRADKQPVRRHVQLVGRARYLTHWAGDLPERDECRPDSSQRAHALPHRQSQVAPGPKAHSPREHLGTSQCHNHG